LKILIACFTVTRTGSVGFMKGEANSWYYSVGWWLSCSMLHMLELGGGGGLEACPPGKFLKINAKMLQYKDIST